CGIRTTNTTTACVNSAPSFCSPTTFMPLLQPQRHPLLVPTIFSVRVLESSRPAKASAADVAAPIRAASFRRFADGGDTSRADPVVRPFRPVGVGVPSHHLRLLYDGQFGSFCAVSAKDRVASFVSSTARLRFASFELRVGFLDRPDQIRAALVEVKVMRHVLRLSSLWRRDDFRLNPISP